MAGAGLIAVGEMTKEDWIFVISIVITLLGMLQDYLARRKNNNGS